MNVLYVNIHRRSIFFDRFFSFFLFSVKNFRGNEEILILILWEESCLHCEVFFWSEWFFWRSKSCTRGKEKSWKIAQRGFSLTIHVLCFFLVGIYIFFFLVWFTFCYFGNEIFVGDTKICFLVQYWSKVAKREMRAKKGGTIDQTFQYKLLVYLYRWINSWIWPNWTYSI